MEDTNQRQRREILEYLQQGNKLTTLYAREVMGIMHPGGRVLELRKQGYNIVTYRRPGADIAGSKHSIAEYVLMTGNPQPDNHNQSDLFAA
jgi:hypothetical protein